MRIADKVLTSTSLPTSLPRFYGIAWRDPLTLSTVVYPMPFNIIARWLRGVHAWIRFSNGDRWLAASRRIRTDAYNEGYEVGIRIGKQLAQEELVVRATAVFAKHGHRNADVSSA